MNTVDFTKHKLVKEFHIFAGDFPIINYEYKEGRLYTYNRINGSRDGYMQFPKEFFDTVEIQLSDSQHKQLLMMLSSLNLGDWGTDKTVLDKMECPGFSVDQKFSYKFDDGYEYICYPMRPIPHEFVSLFDLLKLFGLPIAGTGNTE